GHCQLTAGVGLRKRSTRSSCRAALVFFSSHDQSRGEQLCQNAVGANAGEDFFKRLKRARGDLSLARKFSEARDERKRFDAKPGLGHRVAQALALRESFAEKDLRAISERDGREKIAVTAKPKQGPLFCTRSGSDASRLLDGARDQRGQQAR